MLMWIAKIIFPLLVYLGGTLVGWGLDDAGAYFSHPARVGYILEALFANWIEVFVTRKAGPYRVAREGETQRQKLYMALMDVRLMAGIVLYPFADRRSIGTFTDNQILRYIGLIVYVGGYSVSNWAIIKMGQQWSGRIEIRENQRLVMSGPYSYVRHPHYLGTLLADLGTAFLFRSWVGALLVIAIDPVYFWMRIRIEEGMLHEYFGEAWEEYCERTWRLVPLIY